MSALLGLNAIAYRLTTGSRATWGAADGNGFHSGPAPSSNFSTMPKVKNIKIPIESGEADVSTRGNNGWKATLPTLKDASIDIEMVYDRTDSDVIALIAAYLSNAVVPMAFLDGAAATLGVMGLWADWQVLKVDKGEELENAQMIAFTVKPALTSVAPEWIKVAAS